MVLFDPGPRAVVAVGRAEHDRGMTTSSITPGSIVVAVDGSKHAARAINWAAAQARLEQRPLAVVHAAGVGDIRSATWAGVAGSEPYVLPDLLHSSQIIVDDAVELARGIEPALTIEAHPVVGDPRHVLVDLSERAHIIVMGSRGRGTFRSMLLGSVSASVSKHASCPIVVCRPVPAGAGTQGVVVGADGTPESFSVIEFAFQKASYRQLPLTLQHCFWDVVAAASGVQDVAESEASQEDLRLLLSESVAGLSEKYPDVEVTLRLAHGLVDEALAHLSEQWALVVIGRHPVHTMSRFLTGSMATAVLERSHCTVAVVPERSDGTAGAGQ